MSLDVGQRPIAEPAFVDDLCFDSVWRLEHLMVNIELVHEAVVGPADGAAFAKLTEGFVGRDMVSVHEVGDYY